MSDRMDGLSRFLLLFYFFGVEYHGVRVWWGGERVGEGEDGGTQEGVFFSWCVCVTVTTCLACRRVGDAQKTTALIFEYTGGLTAND